MSNHTDPETHRQEPATPDEGQGAPVPTTPAPPEPSLSSTYSDGAGYGTGMTPGVTYYHHPSSPNSTPTRRMPRFVWALLGCFPVGLVILGIVAYRGYLAVTESLEPARAAGRHFLELVGQRRDEQAYALGSTGFHATLSLKDFHEFADDWRKQDGGVKIYNSTGWQFHGGPQGTIATIGFSTKGTRREGNAIVTLIKEDGEWRVQRFDHTMRGAVN